MATQLGFVSIFKEEPGGAYEDSSGGQTTVEMELKKPINYTNTSAPSLLRDTCPVTLVKKEELLEVLKSDVLSDEKDVEFEPYEPSFMDESTAALNDSEYFPSYVPSDLHNDDEEDYEEYTPGDVDYDPTQMEVVFDEDEEEDQLEDEEIEAEEDGEDVAVECEDRSEKPEEMLEDNLHDSGVDSGPASPKSPDTASCRLAVDENKNETAEISVNSLLYSQVFPFRHETPIENLEKEVEQMRKLRTIKRKEDKELIFQKASGVGSVIAAIRGDSSAFGCGSRSNSGLGSKRRYVLDFEGRIINNCRLDGMRVPEWLPLEDLVKREMVEKQIMQKAYLLEQIFELPPAPDHPKRVEDVRRLVRQRMHRCKICKNRFGERILLEFHMKKMHPDEYLEYLLFQEREAHEQRMAEIEQNRIDEISFGGFIPPEEDYMAENVDHRVEDIPLPGEGMTGKIPRIIDEWGTIWPKPRPRFRKKVSPQCPLCDKRFRNDLSLKKHICKKHPEAKELTQCLKCFKIVGSPEDLDGHLCDLTFLCFECTPIRNMCTAIRLANHRAKFHRGPNSGFKCNDCNMKFLTPRKLRKHKKMTHVFTKTFACHFCDELFTSEMNVITHERIHTGIIKFECQICDFRCNRYTEMETHKRNDHGYLCSICQATFGEWAEIKTHTLTDHGGYLTEASNYIESPRVWVMFKGE